jgi:hypothetical protein
MRLAETMLGQIKNNSVAIISLLAAIGGFMFDTWRDHQNEMNQNMRKAAFEVLKDLGELQTIVNYAHYEADVARGNPIEGWKYAIQIRDLSHLMNLKTAKEGQKLYEVWQLNWPSINKSPLSEQQVSEQISLLRTTVIENIDQLK